MQKQQLTDTEFKRLIKRQEQTQFIVSKQLADTRAAELKLEQRVGMNLSQLKQKFAKLPKLTLEQAENAKKEAQKWMKQQNANTTMRPPKNRVMI